MGVTAEGFLERARMEADRYGSDPWVFVRELLQNARDAGAGEVRFTTERSAGTERIVCRDDGEGMTFEHARTFLFKLYSSSKRDDADAAGRFGIGFWSVLRFEPARIIVRSRPSDGDGWEVAVDGRFRSVRRRSLVMRRGTEIVLERAAGERDLAASIAAAVRSQVRRLMQRDDPATEVQIFLNDEIVELDREPPPPFLAVEEPGLHLTAALAESPRVDVFAKGLRVRRVAFLDELLTEKEPTRSEAAELPEGLLPRVTMDSSRLEVLLARGDARHDRTMAALVGRARRELGRLVDAELDRISGRSRWIRLWDRIRASSPRWRWMSIAVVAVVAVAIAAGLLWRGPEVRSRDRVTPPAPAEPGGQATVIAASGSVDDSLPHRDLAMTYGGPMVESLARPGRIDLSYRPVIAQPLFGALRLRGLDEQGRPLVAAGGPRGPYRGPACVGGCLAVEVRISGGPGLVGVPVASGHRIDPDSVLLDGAPAALVALETGDAALLLDKPTTGVLSYLSGPAPSPQPNADPSWPGLPAGLAQAVDELAAVETAARAARAAELVSSVVAYDRSHAVAERWHRLRSSGVGFLSSVADVGAGDCDVQNSVLAALLSASGTPSWLVVGYVGMSGRLRPGLHAWVEYRDGGQWWVVDASDGGEWSPPVPAPADDAVELERSAPGVAADDEVLLEEAEPSEAGGRWFRHLRWVTAVALLAALAVLVALAMRRRLTSRSLEADGTVDLARLLRSALLRPGAFGGVAALFDRPLVPAVDGRRLSIRTVISRSRAARLFRSGGSTALAVDAARRGQAVLDAGSPAGAAVADLLGARDLDAWDGLLDRAHGNAATGEAEQALRRLGAAWTIVAAEDPPQPVATIEGRVLGRGHRRRVAVIDSSSPTWRVVEAEDSDRPSWAALVLAEGLAHRLDMTGAARQRWLIDLARRALGEEGVQRR